MKTLISLFGLCAGMFLLSGCESTKQVVRIPDQTKSIQDPDHARIYVMRHGKVVGGAFAMPVNADNHGVGYLGAGGYLCWERPAEEVEIKVGPLLGQDVNMLGKPVGPVYDKVSEISKKLSLEPGKTYYLRYRIEIFPRARGELVLLNEQDGKALLRKCKHGKYVSME
jgi:hypothetical protein